MKIVGMESLCDFISDVISKGYTIVCVGTYVRSDDRAALEVCNRVSELGQGLRTVLCEYGLENCIHRIKEMGLNKLAVFDAIAVEGLVKGVVVLGVDEVGDRLQTISSHYVPVERVIDYLTRELGELDVLFVGIPAKNLGVGLDISPEVQEVVDGIALCFANASSGSRGVNNGSGSGWCGDFGPSNCARTSRE